MEEGGGVHPVQCAREVTEWVRVHIRPSMCAPCRPAPLETLPPPTAAAHRRMPLLQALMLESVDRSTAHEAGSTRGVGAGTDSYYEYLVKYWVLGGSSDEHFRSRWENATDEALAELMVYPKGRPFAYVGDLRGGHVDGTLEHLRCFYPGSVALGVMAGGVSGAKAERYLQFAANMTTACFQLYNGTHSGAEGGEGWQEGCCSGGRSGTCAAAPGLPPNPAAAFLQQTCPLLPTADCAVPVLLLTADPSPILLAAGCWLLLQASAPSASCLTERATPKSRMRATGSGQRWAAAAAAMRGVAVWLGASGSRVDPHGFLRLPAGD